jgi:hypothetical protein
MPGVADVRLLAFPRCLAPGRVRFATLQPRLLLLLFGSGPIAALLFVIGSEDHDLTTGVPGRLEILIPINGRRNNHSFGALGKRYNREFHGA